MQEAVRDKDDVSEACDIRHLDTMSEVSDKNVLAANGLLR
jgi:hypothetical protein